MDQRDYHYYEVNEATINLWSIASCNGNAQILQRLRDGDENLNSITLNKIYCCGNKPNEFVIRGWRGDDFGWLGYFIGKSGYLQELSIRYWPKGEGREQQSRALVEGIARNQSIRTLRAYGLSDDVFSEICAEVLINLSQLEVLHLGCNHYSGFDYTSCCSALALGTALRLRSGTTKLKELRLFGPIGDIGVAYLEHGFARIGPFLKTLDLTQTSIGNDGLMALVRANCTGLERLYLSENDFALAAAGLGSLSKWLQRKQLILKELYLNTCGITDEGLQALAEAEGVANNCEELNLSYNDSITATGLSHLSHVLLSERCRLQRLSLNGMDIGDDCAEALAAGLAGNQSLRRLCLCFYLRLVTPRGWSAFSKALCDTSSINNTYLSNHYVGDFWYANYDDEPYIDKSVLLYLRLNKQHQQHAAKCKILMSHPHLDMKPFLGEPFLHWGLTLLPLVVAWFERAKPCTTLTIQTNSFNRRDSRMRLARRVLEESDEVYQSRVLTAMYQFVRELPMNVLESREALISEAWKDQITMAAEEIKRLREDVEQRDGKIARLEEENKRLGKIIIESAKRSFSGSES